MTAQMPDRIVLDGGEHALLCTPLDEFLVRMPDAPALQAPHSANQRGYVARWEVRDDRVFLIDVNGWVGSGVAGGGGTVDAVGAPIVLPGVRLPLHAAWVSGQLRIGGGAEVRHVHAGFESRYQREVILEVSKGVVVGRSELGVPGAMGMAGPYRLEEPLLGELSGGGFGQLIAAFDLDGRSAVAKVPRPTGGEGGTEMWVDDRPVHVPARAFADHAGEWLHSPVPENVTSAVLRAEDELLDRDGGVLLPLSLGVWEHQSSGVPVLVMERLDGRRAETVFDVRAVLEAVARAVERGTFDAHGDLKHEHVFIQEDGRVRICDPAPRFVDTRLRAYTPIYNPHGWAGPAADVIACASMLRYLAGGPGAAAPWAEELLGHERPPAWAENHRAAIFRFNEVLADGPGPTRDVSRPPTGPPFVEDRPAPPSEHPKTSEHQAAIDASVDRIVVAAVDAVLGLWVTPEGEAPELHEASTFAADRAAVDAALRSVVEPSVMQPIMYGSDSSAITAACVVRMSEWGSNALSALMHPSGFDVGAIELRLPPGVSSERVRSTLDHTSRRYNAWRMSARSPDAGSRVPDMWSHGEGDGGVAELADLPWVAATLVATVARVRREEFWDARGGLATVLDEVAAYLARGNTAWDAVPGAMVVRPRRYPLRAFFDAGSGSMLWAGDDAGVDRWDYQVDHFDLPVPLSLAALVQRLVVRHELAHPDVGREHVPFAPGEYDEFMGTYDDACDELERALGPAYTITERLRLL